MARADLALFPDRNAVRAYFLLAPEAGWGIFNSLPLSNGMEVTDSPQARERATTILVAEDDDALRGLVTRVFWDQGFRTLEARHGGEALHLAELAAPYLDLVVTDVIMPEVDGLELGRRLAQRWASIPILYISAYPPNDIFSRGGPSKPSPFLQKPFTPEVLLQRVRELLNEARGL